MYFAILAESLIHNHIFIHNLIIIYFYISIYIETYFILLMLGDLMCVTQGSMSPLITVLLAVIFQKKRFSTKTWLSMPVICMGLAMCSVKA